MTRVALFVDSREIPGGLFGGTDLEGLVRGWRQVEAGLQDGVLSPGTVLPVPLGTGRIEVTVLSPPEPVTFGPDTDFGIVSVFEPRRVHDAHRCATCSGDGRVTYAPFACAECPTGADRVCEEHARLLPGGMAATCPAHRPDCTACGAPPAARCPGPRCMSGKAWCARHLQAHPSDPETGYCADCRDELFPACGNSTDCPGIGSVPCDHVDAAGKACGARRCPRHAWRWQVFGPQAVGLGRCEAHASTQAERADEVLYQILGACALKEVWPPTAPSLRHAVIKSTGQQVALRDVVDLALRQGSRAPALRRQLARLVGRSRPSWERQVTEVEVGEQRATEALVDWLTGIGRSEAAGALTVRNWVRPRDDRSGALWVYCDRQLLPFTVRKQAAEALGFDVIRVP